MKVIYQSSYRLLIKAFYLLILFQPVCINWKQIDLSIVILWMFQFNNFLSLNVSISQFFSFKCFNFTKKCFLIVSYQVTFIRTYISRLFNTFFGLLCVVITKCFAHQLVLKMIRPLLYFWLSHAKIHRSLWLSCFTWGNGHWYLWGIAGVIQTILVFHLCCLSLVSKPFNLRCFLFLAFTSFLYLTYTVYK